MGVQVTNNAWGTLASGISNSATTIVLTAGQGSRFPAATPTNYFWATLSNSANTTWEIVKVTGRTTDTLTVVRGQDGTSGLAWSASDRFEIRPVAALFNDKLNTVDAAATYAPLTGATVTASGDMTSPLQLTPLRQVQQYGMFRNLIINGNMAIDQRGNGASRGFGPGNIGCALDRWKITTWSTLQCNVQQQSGGPTGYSNFLRLTNNGTGAPGAANKYTVSQAIEGYTAAKLQFGTANASAVALSFWVRSSVTGTYSGAVRNDNTRTYLFTYTISAANTWEQKTVLLVGDTGGTWVKGSGKGLEVAFDLGSGSAYRSATTGSWLAGDYWGVNSSTVFNSSGATWDLTGVQLEAGSSASPFEWRPYATEFQLCQRYYAVAYANALFNATAGSQSGTGVVPYPVQMRTVPATPSIVQWYQEVNALSVTFDQITAFGCRVVITSTAAGVASFVGSVSFDAEL